jgi:hypothetical protein
MLFSTGEVLIMSKILGKVFLLAVISLFIFSSGVFAKPVSMQMAEDVARTHLRANNERERLAALTAQKVFENRSISTPDIIELQDNQTGEILAYVLGLNPEGFIVVSPDTDITPVIAYSFKGNFPLEDFQDNVLLHMVTWDMENRLEAIPILPDELKEKNNDLWEKYLSAENSFLDTQVRATTYGPHLTTYWHQGYPYNYYCPNDPFEGEKSAVGCVATAMAQIINYHQYPSSVTFTSADNYCYYYPGTSFERCNNNAASVSISSITYPASTDTAAKLSRSCGVSVQMAYSATLSGISSHSVVASAFKNKFGYTSATHRTPISPSALQKNMQNAQPAVLGIQKTGARHSIVCDGYRSTTGQYHLNYGWGTDDQSGTPSTWWYTLPSGMPDGYNDVFDGVLDIKPPTPGGNDYCRDYGPCSEGQGDCDPGQCESGLTCVNNVGPKYGWSSETDVCEKSTGGGTGTPGGNSYCTTSSPCSAGQGDCDSNAECQSGLTCVDNVGAAYSYRSIVEVCERTSGGTPGANNYCAKYGPCSAGQGDCDSDSECQSGLTCVNDVGPKYGWSSATDVCE